MIDQFINFVVRPPRAEYNPDCYLWESEFTLAGRKYKRQDLELINGRGHTLQCSHYVPSDFPENTALPCVIYCHGNSGCRADANEAAVVLLPSNITVFTLDFSGSGLSGGDYVSLGWHEKEDLKVAVSYLRSTKEVSRVGLWGRSMGAVTSLLYGAEDTSVAGMVVDSAFSNLFNLMMELVDVYKIRLPKFTEKSPRSQPSVAISTPLQPMKDTIIQSLATELPPVSIQGAGVTVEALLMQVLYLVNDFSVKMAVQYMRRVIQKKAKFDIMDLNAVQFAPKTFIPALFGHASEDIFIAPHHSDLIYQAYAGDKNIIKFVGDHNSPRPQFYYDSVSIFFYNVLHPPQISLTFSSTLDRYYDLGDLKVGAGTDESLLYEIITGLRALGTDAASSSSAPPSIPNSSTTKSVVELLSESITQMSMDNDIDFILDEDNTINENGGSRAKESHLQDKSNGQNEELCSNSSSTRESWGRCSSLGGSEESSSTECTGRSNKRHQRALKALATPLRRIQRRSVKPKEKKKIAALILKKPKLEKLEKRGGTLTQRLRLCIMGPGNLKQKRHPSS